jgi:hypothetical protein
MAIAIPPAASDEVPVVGWAEEHPASAPNPESMRAPMAHERERTSMVFLNPA